MFSSVTVGARRVLRAAAAVIGLAAFALPAAAGVALTSASPGSITRAGDVITYTFTISGETSTVTAVSLTNLNYPVSGLSCVGLPLAANGTTTCTATYTVTASDVAVASLVVTQGFLNQFAGANSYTLTTNGGPRTGQVTGSINTTYVAPVPSASIAPVVASVTEDGPTSLSFRITLSEPTTSTLTVGYGFGGTATIGTDTNTPGTSRTILPGDTTATISVNPTSDTTVEPDETVIVTLNSGAGYTVGSPNSATGTILNDDVSATPNLSINDVSASEGNSGTTNFGFTVSLSSPAPAGGVTFTASSADGTAIAGSDYIAVTYPVTIPAGESSTVVVVQVLGDATQETNETFFANITNVTGATVIDGQGQGTIVNDDVGPPSLSVDNVSISEGNSGTTNYTFTISLNQPAGAGGVTFDYATANGTATAGVDYTAFSGIATIASGLSSTTVSVLVSGDTAFEGDETFFLNVTNVTGATVTDGQGLGTILNDDNQPTVSINDVNLTEGNSGTSNMTFTVSLSNPSGATITLDYATSDLSATAGVDYTAATGTVTFAPGETSKPILVPIIGDTAIEGNESFTVNLSNLSTGASFTDAQGAGGILNDDVAPNLTINDVSQNEGNSGSSNFTFTVQLSTPAPAGGVTFNYATANNTATAGVDYTAATGSGSIASGASSTTISVPVTGDIAFEPNETFFVNVSNAANATVTDGQGQGTIQNDDPQITITPAGVALTGGQAGAPYLQQLTATGGTAPYTWAITALALPDGLTLNPSTGAISGTPTRVGTFAFNVTVTTSDGTASKGYTIQIIAPTLTPTPAASTNLGTGRIGQAFAANVSAAGGTAPYSYSIDVNPPGLSINPTTGAITGSPTAAGTYNFSVTMTDSTTGTGSPFSITVPYAVTILPDVTISTVSPLPGGQAGVAYNQTLTATGGNGPSYTFSLTGGALPAGLTLSSAGVISGTPTAAGPTSFTVTAQDPGGFTGSKVLALNIGAPTITIAPTTLTAGTVATPVNQTITASGGTAPYTYSLFSGALPAGVTLATNGTLSGTPTAGGTFNFQVLATDSTTGVGSPFTGSRGYTWTINAPTLAMTPASGALPAGQQGVNYSQTLAASGGTAPYTYALFSGTLPGGVTINPTTGALSGTPNTFGAFSFAIRATDSSTGTGPYTVTNNYTLNVQQAVPTITSVTPNNGTTAGGTSVTITGTNFQNASAVTFGGTAATAYTVVNATTITATTPARAAGAVAVAVTTPGGTVTLANGYTYVAPGSVRFDITSDEDGSFVFTSATAGLNFTVNTVGGAGSSPTVTLQPGNYTLAFTTPSGFGLASASCTPSTSTVSTSAKTAALVVASNVTTVCTIQSLASRQAAVEAIGTALDTSSRLIIANAPDVGRRLQRLNGGGSAEGTASAFGKTFASGLPFSATIGADELRFAMSLSGLRAQRTAHTFAAPANENGVPAALAASVEPGSALAATDAAAAATAAITDRKGPRFDVWVEGVIAQFDAAASSDGSFMIMHAGADYLVTDNLLVGVGIQGDWLNMDTATGSLDSQGWLAGPYLTARIAENLYLDARAAWGGATFDVSPFNTYTDTVDSDRELYTAALIGEFKLGELLTVRPEGRVTWYKETTDSYIDSLSVFIPSVEIKTGEATFGPDFEWTLTRENGGVLMPKIGFDLIWTFQQDNTATAFTNAPGLKDTGVRGRIEGGLTYINPEGVTVGANLFYDGIGGGDYQSWGGTASIRFGF